jgi:hypothetical protein
MGKSGDKKVEMPWYGLENLAGSGEQRVSRNK